MNKIISVEESNQIQKLQRKKLNYKIGTFCAAILIAFSNTGCGFNQTEKDFSQYEEGESTNHFNLKNALYQTFNFDILTSPDKIKVYHNLNNTGYLLSYDISRDISSNSDEWEILGTFEDYDISSDLLSFYNQTNETVNCYREYVREYNANTNQYSEWHSTDNTIAITDAVPQITPTSEWRLDAFDNTNTYTYQDLNIYTSDSFVVPTSGEINDATNTTSSIYIGIDNLENDLKTVSPAKWENKGNLDNYVNSMTHTVERGR